MKTQTRRLKVSFILLVVGGLALVAEAQWEEGQRCSRRSRRGIMLP